MPKIKVANNKKVPKVGRRKKALKKTSAKKLCLPFGGLSEESILPDDPKRKKKGTKKRRASKKASLRRGNH